jgi:hypothetical protein
MSLSGIMGIGLLNAGAQNPWSSESPVAVDFQRAGKGEVVNEGSRKEIGVDQPSAVPTDYVTLHSWEAPHGGGLAADVPSGQAGGGGSAFAAIA